MAPRLKVFVTSDGLTDYVVATSSKAKALAAWGIRQDVFKEGLAHETEDPELTAAATARPGEVLRRPAGTRGELAKQQAAKAPPKPKGPSKAELKKVADLEARLAELDAAHDQERTRLEHERAELEHRAESVENDHAARREKLEAALSAARQALG
jgi:FtsZ-binding cell division protein ZapB